MVLSVIKLFMVLKVIVTIMMSNYDGIIIV